MPKRNVKKSAASDASENSAEVNSNNTSVRSLRARKPLNYDESKQNENENTSKKEKRSRPAPRGKKTKNADEKVSAKDSDVGENGEAPDEENTEMETTFVVKKGGKKAKAKAAKSETMEDSGEPASKKSKEEKVNKTENDYSSQDFSSDKTTPDGKPWNLKISSWNVDGLRAWLKKDGLQYIVHENPDVICLQEIKCSKDKLPPEAEAKGYHCYWASGEKEGYSGVALFSKIMPLEVQFGIGDEEYDSEGRLICAEFEKFYLVTTYVPNAGRGLVTLPKRLNWDAAFREYLKNLDEKKPVIICGDMNVSHKEIDLANPKTNTKNAGFTKEEREGMTTLLEGGFVDTFRHLYPEEEGAYTFWTYMRNSRSKNVGWRLDYFLTSERFVNNICDNVIRNQVYGSDHCPITLLLNV